MELEQSDVVVQGLAVVVVVDVGGGHPQCLGPGRAVPLSEVVVSHPHVDRVTSPDDAERVELSENCGGDISYLLGDAVSRSEDPLCANESSATEVLVERVDESHLPAPLARGRVLPAHHPAGPVAALHSTDVLVGHQGGRRPLLHQGGVVLVLGLGLEGEVGADELQRVVPSAGELRPAGLLVVVALEAGLGPDQDLLLFLHFRLWRAADGAFLGTFEQLAGLGVTEAGEGEVGRNAGAGALGSLVRLLCGPGRGGGRGRRGPWRRGLRCSGRGRSGGGGAGQEATAGHQVEERHQLAGSLGVAGDASQQERSQGLDQGGHVRPRLLGWRPGNWLLRTGRRTGRRWGLPLDLIIRILVVTAERSLLTLGGDGDDHRGGRAETLHGGGQTDAGTVDDLDPTSGGRRRSLGSLGCLHLVGGCFSLGRSPGDATPSTARADG